MNDLTPITPLELHEKLKANGVRLIDVREPHEYARESISKSVSMPLSAWHTVDLDHGAEEITVFMCHSGQRTTMYGSALKDKAPGKAYVLEGGISGWKRAGLGIVNAA
ncbi:MAG: sulfurtransferase [Rhodospirillaceae bacterium]|nr:MAG: sulfurtransferase [Rhodospirillaceae bacterium]